MALIADILLVAAAVGATFYCFVLSRRLSKFNDLERGVGGAVAVLSAQVDDMTQTLERAEGAARASTTSLDGLTSRAEDAAKRLELLVAALHDLPEASAPPSREADSPQAPMDEPEDLSSESAESTSEEGDTGGVLFLRHRVDASEQQA